MFTNSAVAAATGSDQDSGLEAGRGAVKPLKMFPASISVKQQEKQFWEFLCTEVVHSFRHTL